MGKSPSNSTLMKTNRQGPKSLIMQSGLISADSQIPHSRQQTHRNVRRMGYTSHTQKSQRTLTRSSNPWLSYLTPCCRVFVFLCAVKLRRPAAKFRKFPNDHNGGKFISKKRKHETDLSPQASKNY